eukprot:TRINITY_DN58314_c0_g1_i1.p1 TRINITY_DN58314_c0_g1~~TRINITY_DN58314_c0_g1_i1.p1  ORF type:complete len:681 (+),score=113.58 TRINITY_DN58314_c0_g1_i1:251-2044(+)
MPLELIAVFFCQGCFLHPVFRLNKLVLVLNMHNMFQQLLSGVFGPRWWRVANALYWWATLGHIVACLFHSIITAVGDSEAFVVLTVEGYSNLPLAHQYMQSLSFAINTMAGLSRGRFPQNDMLSAFALCVVVVGVFVYALLLAVVAAGLTMHGQEGKFNEFIDELKSIFSPEVRAKRLPKSFVKEILDYHSHVFHSTGQLTLADDILQDLPQEMRVGIDLVLGRETIGRVSLLESVQTDELVYALQQCLSLVVYPPGWDVIETGEEGSDMYFISSGTCAVLGSDGEPVYDLKRGDVFGEISLLTSVLRTATIRTLTYVNLLVLSSSDFYMVAAAFPGLLEKVQDKARSRIRTIRDGTKVSSYSAPSQAISRGFSQDTKWSGSAVRRHSTHEGITLTEGSCRRGTLSGSGGASRGCLLDAELGSELTQKTGKFNADNSSSNTNRTHSTAPLAPGLAGAAGVRERRDSGLIISSSGVLPQTHKPGERRRTSAGSSCNEPSFAANCVSKPCRNTDEGFQDMRVGPIITTVPPSQEITKAESAMSSNPLAGQSATATPQTEESVDIGDEDLLDWIKRQHTSNDRPKRMSARPPRGTSRNHR